MCGGRSQTRRSKLLLLLLLFLQQEILLSLLLLLMLLVAVVAAAVAAAARPPATGERDANSNPSRGIEATLLLLLLLLLLLPPPPLLLPPPLFLLLPFLRLVFPNDAWCKPVRIANRAESINQAVSARSGSFTDHARHRWDRLMFWLFLELAPWCKVVIC